MSRPDQDLSLRPNAVARTVRLGALLDLYGGLLTDRQQEFMRLHFLEDLSFGEISGEYDVSRQAVHDAVKNAEAALENYEAKLGLLAKADQGAAPAAANAEALGALADGLAALHAKIQRSGGVIYNGEAIGRELADLIDQLRAQLGK